MSIQTQPVAGSVKKSNHLSIGLCRLIPRLLEKVLHFLMDLCTGGIMQHPAEPKFLSASHGVIEFANQLARTASHDRARDIAKVTCFPRTRENVQDNRSIGSQQAMTLLVGIARLVSTSEDK